MVKSIRSSKHFAAPTSRIVSVNDVGASAAPRASGRVCVADVIADLAHDLENNGMAEPRRLATDVMAALLEVPRSWPALNGATALDQPTIAATRTAAAR